MTFIDVQINAEQKMICLLKYVWILYILPTRQKMSFGYSWYFDYVNDTTVLLL